MKIGYFGADGHGKSTLMAAVLAQAMGEKTADGIADSLVIHMPSRHHRECLEELKEESTLETIKKFLRRGGRVDLGCDPGMTQEGRELQRILYGMNHE